MRWRRSIVAHGLVNPRGVLQLPDGAILVAEAGTGDPANPLTGRLSRLLDRNADGDADDDGERSVIADRQASTNILQRLAVNRDEVFGMADIASGDGAVLVTLADPQKGSTILRVEGERLLPWGTTKDNANSIAWHPRLGRWFAVQSFANTVIELGGGGTERLVATLPMLPQGQHPVPSGIVVEPASGKLLVANFSGQLGGDTAGSGVDFVERSGTLVRIDPATGDLETVVTGLNAPVDLGFATDGRLFVLEFCRRFTDPVHSSAEATAATRHAGFERFSGRLLELSLGRREARVLADDLDEPTELSVTPNGDVLVTEGQGTPGRMLPGKLGPTLLEGRLLRFTQS